MAKHPRTKATFAAQSGSRVDLTDQRPTNNGHIAAAEGRGERLTGTVIQSVYDVQRQFIRLISGILVNSDVAYRKDRRLQKMMRHDPDVMAPLLDRQYAVALLEWDIVPEDDEDAKQVEQAKALKKLITCNMPRWHAFIRQMQEAVWYGPSAANVVYERTKDGIAPKAWYPFHSDTLVFTKTGQLGFRVNPITYKGETVIAWDAMAHIVTPSERRSIVCHTFMPEAPDFEDGYESRYMFAGRGLRDVLWYHWLIKQTVLQLWTTYAERYAMGIRKGTYPDGNDPAKQAMETAMQNLLGDVSLLMPRMIGKDGQQDAYSFEILEPSGDTSSVFATLINDYLAGKIKEMIIGQTATTEATTSGLGANIGDQHAETHGRIIRFDAYCLADTLSKEFVHVLHEMNFGDTPYKPRLEFNCEDVDSEQFMNSVEKFVNLGGEVGMRSVRSRIGLEEPKKGEPLLEVQEMDMGGDFGGGGTNPNKFARAMAG